MNENLSTWRDALTGVLFTADTDLEFIPTATTPDTGRSGTMRLMTCNVRNTPDMPRKKVVKAAEQVRGKAGIIGFQEIIEDEDLHDIWKGLGRGVEYRLIGGRPNPIAFKVANFRVAEVRTDLAHRKLPGVKGPVYTTQAVFSSIKRPNLGEWAVLNTHMIPGAFNNQQDFRDARRQELWRAHWSSLKNQVDGFYKRGIPTFIMGDFNRGSVRPLPRLHRDQKMLVPFGIDRIIYVPGRGFDMMKTNLNRINTTSDHDAISVTVRMQRNKG